MSPKINKFSQYIYSKKSITHKTFTHTKRYNPNVSLNKQDSSSEVDIRKKKQTTPTHNQTKVSGSGLYKENAVNTQILELLNSKFLFN